jgi:hemoglobin-like flavoprotein
MRINSASRSDIFNEYVKIISNFNEKRSITKGASTGDVLRGAANIGDIIDTAAIIKAIGEVSSANGVKATFEKMLKQNLFTAIDSVEALGKDGATVEDFEKAFNIYNSKVGVNKTTNKYVIYPSATRVVEGVNFLTEINKINAIKTELITELGLDFNKVNKFFGAIKTKDANLKPYLKKEVKQALDAVDAAPPVEPAAAAKPNANEAAAAPEPAAPKSDANEAAIQPVAPPAASFIGQEFLTKLRGFNELSDVSKNAIKKMVFY